jgi:hypothetical protein
MNPHQPAPPGFIGGRRVSLTEWHSYLERGYWRHDGDHPAYAVSIRFGWCADLGRWYVDWSGIPTARWLFARVEDAELALTELRACREGEWVTVLDPAKGISPVGTGWVPAPVEVSAPAAASSATVSESGLATDADSDVGPAAASPEGAV